MTDSPYHDLVRHIPADVLAFFSRHRNVLILGHLEPDADCIGSEVALASALRHARGLVVQLANPGPFERPEISSQANRFIMDPDEVDRDATGVVVLDCSSADRIEPFSALLGSRETLVIDHHRAGQAFGDLQLIRPDIPANTILVTALLDALEIAVEPELADLLFLGLATDTGFFRFLDETQGLAFAAAERLSRAGASARRTAEQLNSGRSWGSRQIIARMLLRTEQLADGSILLSHMTSDDEREHGNRRDTDSLYGLLLSIEHVRVIAVVKEKADGCTVSFRANDATDVSELAARIGGGGHQKAAGAFIPHSLSEALPTVRQLLGSIACTR